MKKTLFLLAAFVVALSLSAQNNADLLTSSAVQLIDVANRAGIKGPIIVGTGEFPVATGPAVSPRTVSPPASAARQTTNNGIPSLKNQGDKITMADGKVYVLCEDGELHEAGEILTDAQGNRFKVMSDGSIEFISGPPPAPANNGGAGSNGDFTLVNSIKDMYAEVPSDKRLLVTGNVQVIDPSGAGAGSTSSKKGKTEKYQLEEGGPWYYDDADGVPRLVERPPYTVHQGRKDVLIGNPNNIAQQDLAHQVVQTKFGYDDTNNPTEATIAAMNNRNGGLGRLLGVTRIGASCDQSVTVYNQRPRAVATYGVRGGDCWRPWYRR